MCVCLHVLMPMCVSAYMDFHNNHLQTQLATPAPFPGAAATSPLLRKIRSSFSRPLES